MNKSSKQTLNGKAFEYALLLVFFERLESATAVQVIKNDSYFTAKSCFDTFGEKEQSEYKLAASFAVNFLLDLEPRLSRGLNSDDELQLEIVSDAVGQSGDVRDVLAIRSLQNWEIGISAKNNHRAVKHSRLSKDIDFGKKWLDIPCSEEYFKEISVIFNMLAEKRKQTEAKGKWSSLGDYHKTVYVPVLKAFIKELNRIDSKFPGVASMRLVEYLVGNKDFYKVIKNKNKVEIQAYNLKGSLNLPAGEFKPKAKVQKLKLPSRLIEAVFQEDSETTILVTLSDGWQISFRIHNASSRIEPSLKFDINLVSAPHTLFTNQLFF